MAFTSFGFIIFVSAAGLLYYLLPKRFQWTVLLLASYAFYAIANPKGLLYIGGTTIVTFLIARSMQRIQDAGDQKTLGIADKAEKKEARSRTKKSKKAVCAVGIAFCFGILAFLKYTNFIIAELSPLLQRLSPGRQISMLDLFVPMGLSFYTFSVAGYLFDIYYGKYRAEENIFHYALFISYFPTLVQGPISRENTLRHEFFEKEHKFSLTETEFAILRILWGFLKKLVIADRASQVSKYIFENYESQAWFIVLFGLFMYSVELYADFSGGMDVALGVSELFGIKLSENFRQPYFATSVADFWRRWHITLGQWMKDYVFYPFSLSRGMQKLGKSISAKSKYLGRTVPMCIGNLLVFFLVGLWHGAEWHFILYGMFHGGIIAFSILMERAYKISADALHINRTSKAWKIWQIARTFLIINLGCLLDEVRNLGQSLGMAKQLFDFSNFRLIENFSTKSFDKFTIGISLFFFACVFFVSLYKENKKGSVRERIASLPLVIRWGLYLALIFSIPAFQASDTIGFMYAKF